MKALNAIFISLLCAQPLAAQAVMTCDWQASAQSIVEPWEENSATFANGNVRIANLDTIEPAVAFAYLLILSPPYSELGDRQCSVIGSLDGFGFAGIDFETLTANYDPASGLVFSVRVDLYEPSSDQIEKQDVQITLNQSSGDIAVKYQKDNE